MKSWHPPVILLALIVPAAVGFAIGGPGLGISIAGLSLVGFAVIAALVIPRDPIGRKPHPELARRLLVVTTFPIGDAAAIQRVADEVHLGFDENEAEIRLVTPATNTFLRRWATDLEKARDRAQRDLVVSVASLNLAGVDASARVGDEDLVQAVEDQLATFNATEVFLLTRSDPDSPTASQLRERLLPRFHHVDL
ncbi:MAG TPA: hypothetical protein PKD76_04730 [Solirubrobacterales bacterium]|nr:hypothetical protein [Solirubrobacterales bacterium]